MGSKQSIPDPPQKRFFQKTVFGAKKSSKSWMFCWFLNFYGNIYGQIRPVLKNLMSGRSESVEILPKC